MIKVCKKLGYRNFSQITILFYFENEEFHSGPTGLLSSRKKKCSKKKFSPDQTDYYLYYDRNIIQKLTVGD